MDTVIRQMLASRNAEALQWLSAASDTSFRNLGEMATTAESIAFVKPFYMTGALKVLACKIGIAGEDQTLSHLLVELPSDKAARAALFALEAAHAESMGYDGELDKGQQYLFIWFD